MAYGYPYNGVWVLACTPINDCRASAAHFLKKGCITMEHKLHLGEERFVRFVSKVHAGANTKLVFESDEYPLDELQITITNGKSAKRYTVKDKRFDLTQHITRACVIEIVVELVMRGTVAKTWVLEPFVVRENGGKYVLIPEVALLREETRRLRKAVCELKSIIKETM